MNVEEDPEPSAWGTAYSGMPVILIPIMQYAAFVDGLQKSENNGFSIIIS